MTCRISSGVEGYDRGNSDDAYRHLLLLVEPPSLGNKLESSTSEVSIDRGGGNPRFAIRETRQPHYQPQVLILIIS